MPRMIEQYFAKEQRLLDRLYEIWPVGQEIHDVNQATLLPEIGDSASGKAMRHFESLGIFSKRLEYGQAGTPRFGRHYHYTLLVSSDEAQRRLDESVFARRAESERRTVEGNAKSGIARRGKPIKGQQGVTTHGLPNVTVALATDDKEDVRAIAGEDAPASIAFRLREAGVRKPDESAALVEAARQYQSRFSTLTSKVAELEALAKDLGVTIDTSLLAQSVSFDPDSVLETVALVLPYITNLEGQVEGKNRIIAELRDKVKGYDALKDANRRLSEQNQRLVSGRVTGAVAHA